MARVLKVTLCSGLCLALACLGAAVNQPKPKPNPAVLAVSGYGLLGNRVLARMLRTLEIPGEKPEYFRATLIEDSAMLLTARVRRDGYLMPELTAELTLANGHQMTVNATNLINQPLPRPLQIKKAVFKIRKGVLYFYRDLQFEGLKVLNQKQARSYFMETETLLHLKKSRIYTPEKFERGISSLKDVLERDGYHDAQVTAQSVRRNDRTGAITARVRVQQGPKYFVRSVKQELIFEAPSQGNRTNVIHPNAVFSRFWEQDYSLSLKTNAYAQGYPDVTVSLKTLTHQNIDNRVLMDLQATVKSGPKVRIGKVTFTGQKKTRPWLLSRRVRVERGELLNPVQVEDGRVRLAELGIFDNVNVTYKPVSEHARDVNYHLSEGKTLEFDLLFGWGSYELLRGGFEADLNNLWGLAHHVRIKAIQSFKSSSGEFVYTIPELLGRDIDTFANASGLRRQEINFTRLEYGGGVGVHKFFKPEATDFSLRYNFQILNALDLGAFPQIATEGVTNPAVGSIIADVKLDRRDNPLYPRQGYKVFASVETATKYLAGDVNYERIEISPSWYHPLGGGRYLSLGLSHGVAISFGSAAQNLPFNKRFFPGGENSIRGYTEGEASPRNALGQLVGAETYTLASVELEQALTPRWSVVVFSDSLGFAEHLNHYPFDTGLFSVGAGIRWRTLIGPVRLEYGYNLNPRPGDPSGTVQFALGFPF